MSYPTFSCKEDGSQASPPEGVDPATNSRCTVCLIESNPLAAEYLAGLLSQDPFFDVRFFDQFVNSGVNGSPLIFCLDQADIVLPLGECLKLLRRSYPEARCILLSAELGTDQLTHLLSSGIHGILRHGSVKECLLEAVRSVCKGLLWVHPQLMHNFSPQNEGARQSLHVDPLTKREYEILHLVRNHFSNKEIATLLEIEESTVKFHLSNILAKRNVSRREDLTTWKMAGGWKALLLAGAGRTNPHLRSLLK